MSHLDKAKSALEYASSYPVRDAKDVALIAIANALVAIAEERGTCVMTGDIADEIEAEISERFMELPVDADGVPIRVGDKVTWDGGKSAAKFTIDTFAFDMEHGEWDVKDSHYMNIFPAHRCRHVKPRTLEDVLREFTDEVIEWSGYSGPVSEDKTWSGMAGKYADEIRAMFGEGADE